MEILVLVTGVKLVVSDGTAAGIVGMALGSFAVSGSLCDHIFDLRTVGEAIFAVDVLFCSEVHEKDQGDGDEDYRRTPGIFCPMSCHANTGIGPDLTVCWVKETVWLLVLYDNGS